VVSFSINRSRSLSGAPVISGGEPLVLLNGSDEQ
jgi:hypothetical protein